MTLNTALETSSGNAMPTLRKIISTNPKRTTIATTMTNSSKDSLVGAVVLHTKNGTTKLTTITEDVNAGGYMKVAGKQNGVRPNELYFIHDAENGMQNTKNIYQYWQKRRANNSSIIVPSFVQLRNRKYYKVKFDDAFVSTVVDSVVAEEEGLVGVGNNEAGGGASSATAGDTTEESPSSSDDDGNDLSPAQKWQKKSTDNEGGTRAKKPSGNNNDDDDYDNDTAARQSGVGAAALDNDDERLAEMGKKEEGAPNDSVSSSVKKRKADDNQVDVSIIVRTDCLSTVCCSYLY